VLVDERPERERRVGDAAGDDDLRAVGERLRDRPRAEIRVRRDDPVAHGASGRPSSMCANGTPAASSSSRRGHEVVAVHDRQRRATATSLDTPRRCAPRTAGTLMPPAFATTLIPRDTTSERTGSSIRTKS
jgi:hypothetical protein